MTDAVADSGNGGARPGAVGAALERTAWGFAALGGLLITAVSLTVVVSVIGRTVGVGGISGDFEVVEIGCGVAAFLFMPICQWRREHIMVDLFSAAFPAELRHALDGVWDVVFGAVWVVVVWRLSHGLVDMLEYGDHTMLLRLPIWTIYVPAMAGGALSALVAAYSVYRHWRTRHEAGRGPVVG